MILQNTYVSARKQKNKTMNLNYYTDKECSVCVLLVADQKGANCHYFLWKKTPADNTDIITVTQARSELDRSKV